ncbi:MAG: hypothetical protein KKB37_11230 [Alphaproteobacteria bacterium]|nr:hypothetical protein [Alphaproteobacteria bacterium]
MAHKTLSSPALDRAIAAYRLARKRRDAVGSRPAVTKGETTHRPDGPPGKTTGNGEKG